MNCLGGPNGWNVELLPVAAGKTISRTRYYQGKDSLWKVVSIYPILSPEEQEVREQEFFRVAAGCLDALQRREFLDQQAITGSMDHRPGQAGCGPPAT